MSQVWWDGISDFQTANKHILLALGVDRTARDDDKFIGISSMFPSYVGPVSPCALHIV